MSEGVLTVSRGDYGYIGVEDDSGNHIDIGEMVKLLLDAGDDDLFDTPQGVDPESLQKLQASINKGVQGGIERWDSDVFSTYYNMDTDRIIRLYARRMNHSVVEESPADDEFEDDGTNEFEEYYS